MKKMALQLATLKTERLTLRPFNLKDAARVKELAGDKLIADVTANIPHPYPNDFAKEWIQTHPERWDSEELASFAITQTDSGLLIGAISLMHMDGTEGELGFWIGVDYWNKGYCSEGCKKMIDFGFNDLKLKRIHATHHLSRNPASGKVLINAGLSHIGSGRSVCGYRKENESTEQYEIKT